MEFAIMKSEHQFKSFGSYFYNIAVATNPSEPLLWANTIDGNRHFRLFSLERVISPDGLVLHQLCIGKYRLAWMKKSQNQNEVA